MYEKAVKLPKNGAVAANEKTVRAWVVREIAEFLIIRNKFVYDWAIRHKMDSRKLMRFGKYIHQIAGTNQIQEVVGMILNDKSWKEA